jgi:predicted RNase H-like nuclease (RuvC/YqgF family)
LRNEALEKDQILLSFMERLKCNKARLSSLSEAKQRTRKAEERQLKDAKRIDDSEYALSTLVELHRTEVQELEKKLDEITENFNVEQTKREISDMERLRLQKNIEELRQAKEERYNVTKECADNLKNNFTKVGAFSSKQNFIRGDPNGVIQWISGEVKAFEEILSERDDFYALAGARGAVSVLEKVGCEHAKAVVQSRFSISANDINNPLVEAAAPSGKFYSEVWLKGG